MGLGAFVILVLALGASLITGGGAKSRLIGQPAPDIRAPLLAGEVPNGAYVVNFWATWCPPCIAEHPVLMQMADNGVDIIGVAYRDDEAKVARYLAQNGNPFSALYFDPTGTSSPDWGLRGVPETFVIGADGIIQDHISGEVKAPIIP
jgi:cytochrome c biogenesis protein CcmG/thiol:disulfide interchange protein DsbE